MAGELTLVLQAVKAYLMLYFVGETALVEIYSDGTGTYMWAEVLRWRCEH